MLLEAGIERLSGNCTVSAAVENILTQKIEGQRIANCIYKTIPLTMATSSFSRIAMRRLATSKHPSPRIAVTSPHAKLRTLRTTTASSRSFSTSMINEHLHRDEMTTDHRMPVTTFTEDEEMVRDAARMWANQELKPLVREMDDECKTRPEVIQGLFAQGFMGMVSSVCTHFL